MENSEYIDEARSRAKKEVIKVTVILSVVTLIELVIGFMMMKMEAGGFAHNFSKGVIIILMMVKAYYIVAHFMHLGHENSILKKLILIPLLIFVWFIIAFLADGASFLNLRQKYDPYSVEMNKHVQPTHDEIKNTKIEE